ncbi:MAG: DUF3854 domain-containing protein [Ruminococcus flavefaciens]|nr:DUF3854 domain-containing protein [Ruminococcus flavefaciens]
MASLTRIAKGQVCPICEHKDWCGHRDDNTYGHIWLCHRYDGRVNHLAVVTKRYGGKEGKEYSDEYRIVDGQDGMYVLLPNNKGCTNFQKYEDWYNYIQGMLQEFERKNQEYCSEHHLSYRPRSSFVIDGCEKFDSHYEYAAPQHTRWKLDPAIIQPLPHGTLDKIFREWLQCMELCKWHRKKLMLEWDVSNKPAVAKVFCPDTIFDNWMIRTLPPDDDIRASAPGYYKLTTGGPTRRELISRLLQICQSNGLASPAGVPGLYLDTESNMWKIHAGSGIVFPVYDADGCIYRLRIGVDTPRIKGTLNGRDGTYRFYRDTWYFDREGKPAGEKSVIAWRYGSSQNLIRLNRKGLPDGKADGKYINLSSYADKQIEETHTITNQYYLGCLCGGCVSVYRPKGGSPQIVWITEGEKKAMVIAAFFNCTVVCLPGVSSYMRAFEPVEGGVSVVEALINAGAKMAIVAFDADKDTNQAVQKAEEGLLKQLWDAGFRMLNATEWHKEFGKGQDDALLDGAMPDFRPVTFNEWK